MFDLTTLAALAVDPAVTLSVIAILTILLVASIVHGNYRLNTFAAKAGKASAKLMALLIVAAEREMKRREQKASTDAIGWTYNQFTRGAGFGFDTVAEHAKATQARTDDNAGGFDTATRPEPSFEDAAGLEGTETSGKGPRPYHTSDFGGRSPRAG